jgi:hypothetical protein
MKDIRNKMEHPKEIEPDQYNKWLESIKRKHYCPKKLPHRFS